MLKYVDAKVVMSEIPDMITLAINLSNCPCKCEGCHSSYLAEDIGTILTDEALVNLIESNPGIDCICLMGGDAEPWYVKHSMAFIKENYPHLKTAWYSGREQLHSSIALNLQHFDYIKLGPYMKDLGPLTNRNTNQKLYEIDNGELTDITYKFWK